MLDDLSIETMLHMLRTMEQRFLLDEEGLDPLLCAEVLAALPEKDADFAA